MRIPARLAYLLLGLVLTLGGVILLMADRDERVVASTVPDLGEDAPRSVASNAGTLAEGSRIPTGEEPKSASGNASPLLELEVTDPRGSPVQGAAIVGLSVDSLTREESVVFQGSADEEGRASMSPGEARELRVIASAEGFATASRVKGPPTRGKLRLVLNPEAIVEGHVVDRDGKGIGGARVLAWPSGYWPAGVTSFEDLRPDDRLLEAIADANGRFVFQGADRGRAYTLVAGSLGRASPEPLRGVRPDAPDLRIECDAVCAIRVRLSDDGAAPRVDPALSPLPDSTWSWPQEEGRWLEVGDPRRSLAGLPAALSVRGPSPTFVFTSEDPNSLGPIEYAADLPGYEPVEARLDAPRFDGRMASVDVPLHAIARGWGVLEVDFGEGAARPGRSASLPEAGRLVLENRATGESSFVPYERVPFGEHRIESLPAGPYRVAFRAALHTLNHGGHAVEVDVLPERTASVDLPLDDLIGVEFQVFLSGGEEYSGRVVVEVARLAETAHGSTFYVLPGPPYVVEGLVPDRYQVSIYEPFIDGPLAFRVAREDLVHGRQQVVLIEP